MSSRTIRNRVTFFAPGSTGPPIKLEYLKNNVAYRNLQNTIPEIPRYISCKKIFSETLLQDWQR